MQYATGDMTAKDAVRFLQPILSGVILTLTAGAKTDFSAKQILSILVKNNQGKTKQQTNKTPQKYQIPCPLAINDPKKPLQNYQIFPYSLYQYYQIILFSVVTWGFEIRKQLQSLS